MPRNQRNHYPYWNGGEQQYENGDGDESRQDENHQSNNGVDQRQGNNSTAAQSGVNLGPFTEVVHEATQQLKKTEEVIKALRDSCTQHARAIEDVPAYQQKYEDLVKQSRHKDERIKRHAMTIQTLKELDHDREASAAEKLASIQENRTKLEAEKQAFKEHMRTGEKTLVIREAELTTEHEKELAKLKMEQNEEFKARMKTQEDDVKKRENEQRNKLVKLETSNQNRAKKIEKLEAKIEEQRLELETAKGRYEDLEKLKLAYKAEKDEIAGKLKSLEEEFLLCSQPVEI